MITKEDAERLVAETRFRVTAQTTPILIAMRLIARAGARCREPGSEQALEWIEKELESRELVH